MGFVLLVGMQPAVAQMSPGHHKRIPSFDYPYPISEARVEAEQILNQGLSKAYQNDLDGAIADLSRATEIDPTDEMAYRYLGDLHRQTGNLDAAIAAYSNALRLNPGFSRLYNSRGEVYLAQKAYGEAIADFTQAISVYPEDPIGYYNRGITNYELKDYPQAIYDFHDAIRISDVYAVAYVGRGKVRQAVSNFKGAVEDFLTAASLLQIQSDNLLAQGDGERYQQLQNQRQRLIRDVEVLQGQTPVSSTMAQLLIPGESQ